MSDISSLLDRLDTEFAEADRKIKEFQAKEVDAYHGRQQRLELFSKVCDGLREVWQPRLQALSQKFGDRVKASPTVTPSGRDVAFRFNTPLAEVVLRFSATTDTDVRKLILSYDLHILPIFMKFESDTRIEFPLENVDTAAVARWFDDRIIDFVKTYLAIHHNDLYLKDHMVVDPVCGTRFPKFVAASTLKWEGKTFYFVSDETRRDFEKKHGIPA